MNQPMAYSDLEEILLDSEIISETTNAPFEKAFRMLLGGGNPILSFPVFLRTFNSLEDRSASDLKAAQENRLDSVATFTRPAYHFFVPGGQQLQFNHNPNRCQSYPEHTSQQDL